MHENVLNGFNGAMVKYGDANSTDITSLLDNIQSAFQCCGALTYENWSEVPYGKLKIVNARQLRTTLNHYKV